MLVSICLVALGFSLFIASFSRGPYRAEVMFVGIVLLFVGSILTGVYVDARIKPTPSVGRDSGGDSRLEKRSTA